MQEWLMLAATVAIGIAGHMAKRWLENLRINELLNRKLKVLEIHRGLRRAGIQAVDLEKIENELANARPLSPEATRDSRSPSATHAG